MENYMDTRARTTYIYMHYTVLYVASKYTYTYIGREDGDEVSWLNYEWAVGSAEGRDESA